MVNNGDSGKGMQLICLLTLILGGGLCGCSYLKKTDLVFQSVSAVEHAAIDVALEESPNSEQDPFDALRSLAGTWYVEGVRWETDGSARPLMGMSVIEWIEEARFLREQYDGVDGEKQQQLSGYIGYDPVREKYSAVWRDASRVTLLTGVGTTLKKERGFQYEGFALDSETAQLRPVRFVLWVSEQMLELRIVEQQPEQAQRCFVEAYYTRVSDE